MRPAVPINGKTSGKAPESDFERNSNATWNLLTHRRFAPNPHPTQPEMSHFTLVDARLRSVDVRVLFLLLLVSPFAITIAVTIPITLKS